MAFLQQSFYTFLVMVQAGWGFLKCWFWHLTIILVVNGKIKYCSYLENGLLLSETHWNLWLGRTSVTYVGYLWPCSIQCHLWSLDAPFSKWHVTRKWWVVERNGMRCGTQRHKKHIVLHEYIWPRSVQYYLGSSDIKRAYLKNDPFLENGWAYSEKDWTFWTRGH